MEKKHRFTYQQRTTVAGVETRTKDVISTTNVGSSRKSMFQTRVQSMPSLSDGSNRRIAIGFNQTGSRRGISRHTSTHKNLNHEENDGEMSENGEELLEHVSHNKGGRKRATNLNHLLNFAFEPRSLTSENRRCKKTTSNGTVKFNKELFILVNCQFVVKSSGDYVAHLHDPDTAVEWDNIEEIILRTTMEIPSCPICLYPPVAAKMSKCGHSFCWTCILHYLALSDKKWRNCPICFQLLCKMELKSMVAVSCVDFFIGDRIEMLLMRRGRQLTNVLPALESSSNGQDLTSKLLLASPDMVSTSIINREKGELMEQLRLQGTEPEACFIEEALYLLCLREESIDETSSIRPIIPGLSILASPQSKPRNSGGETLKEDVYFYQSSDGQFIFLHSINVMMLQAMQVGGSGLKDCPASIYGRILEKETIRMTQDIRKRWKHLGHLTLGASFSVCELELGPEFISEEVKMKYEEQVRERQDRRDIFAANERQREEKIDVQCKRQQQMLMRPQASNVDWMVKPHVDFESNNISLSSRFDFPEVGGDPLVDCTDSDWEKISRKPYCFEETSGVQNNTEDKKLSFANMLRIGARRPPSSETSPNIVQNSDMGELLSEALERANLGALPKQPKKPGIRRKMRGHRISLTDRQCNQ